MSESRRNIFTWVIAAVPAIAIALCLTVPSLRRQLLTSNLEPAQTPPSASRPTPRSAAPAARPFSRPSLEARTSQRASSPPISSTAPSPAISTTEAPSVAATVIDEETVAIAAEYLGEYLSEAYRGDLPAAVGLLIATIDDAQLTLASTVDLAALRSQLANQVPDSLGFLMRGNPKIELTGELVDAGGGIAHLKISAVRIAGVPLSTAVLSEFLSGELEARGYIVEDPLVRPLYLPDGFDSASLGDAGLVLMRAAPAPPSKSVDPSSRNLHGKAWKLQRKGLRRHRR